MKFIKKVTFLVLFLFVVNLIMPNVDVQAFVDSNTSKINSNEELGLIFQDEMSIEDVNFDSENISDEGEDVNNINEEKRSVGDEPVVIKLENPIENHKLTGSFLSNFVLVSSTSNFLKTIFPFSTFNQLYFI